MLKKISGLLAVLSVLLAPGIAAAHVVVTPSQAAIGDHIVFTVSVPNEEDVPVTKLKLDVPSNVTDATPTTKDGWTIETTKEGDDVKSITWSEGEIPAGQRQDFTFSAQMPAKAADVSWKAYQTYQDGTIVSWNQKPTNEDTEGATSGPYSITKVVDDLSTEQTEAKPASANLTGPYVLAGLALLVAFAAFVRKK